MATQTVKNHVRFDPPYHFVLVPMAVVLLVAAGRNLVRNPGAPAAFDLLAGVWALMVTLKFRLYALKVQDRVIRLEEQIRLRQVLPAAQQAGIGQLTEDQLIGLRFAPDSELPELMQKTLEGKWDRKQIKSAVRNWRPDNWRV